jgi:S-DNA-T family DNA segregation ATPase FtsK/SpoIIIE
MPEPQVLVFRGNTMPSQQKNGHQENDNIIVRKFGSSLQPGLSYTNNDSPSVLPLEEESKPQQQKTRGKKTNVAKATQLIQQQEVMEPVRDFTRQWKVIAVFSMLFAFLLAIALITYTQADAANAELSMRDVSGIVRGDDEMRARADTTQNWLGLFGAVISNFLYNHTFGIATLMLPAIIVWWAKHLFVTQSIPRIVMKRTATAIILGVCGAAIFGVFQLTPWMPTFSPEWSGAIGQFLASVLSDFIGKIGAFLLLTAAFTSVLFVGAELDIDKALHSLALAGDYVKQLFMRPERDADSTQDQITMPVQSEEQRHSNETMSRSAADEDEPANIMRRVTKNMKPQDQAPQQKPIIQEPVIKRPQEQLRTSVSEPPIPKHEGPKQDLPRETNTTVKPMTTHTDLPPQRFPVPPTKVSASLDLPPLDDDEYAVNTRTGEIIAEGADVNNISDDFMQDHHDISYDETFDESADMPLVPSQDKPSLVVTVQDSPILQTQEVVEPIFEDDFDKELDYTPPGLELLAEPPSVNTEIDEAELAMNARLLQEKLSTFKITIENLEVTPGPVVTQYEFVPAAGIKISQIESLSDDMALALKARGIRIIAPIPGKGTVGIEIPNHNPTTIFFRSIINNPKFNDSEHRLPLALGKTISGEVYIADLAKMPHLLIAGATGAGKSVGVNTMIASLLYKMHPKNLKLVFIDPKKVEMSFYSALEKHFLAICPDVDERIITNPANAVLMLKSLVAEMERRYDILASVGQRNIVDYNKKVEEGKYKDTTKYVHRQMPYIVVVIDELADLMMTAAKEVEEPIARLAQLARAIGIHLIVATQRPSVNVITGYIKANFPARVAYQVASKIDSRTILDMNGADQLLGNGDMLFLPGGSPKPIRLQNSFLSTDEVEAICNFIADQDGYANPYMLPSVVEKNTDSGGSDIDLSAGRDALFADAAAIVVTHQQGSVSLLQRRLKVGYARAARIMDELEAAGIVGPFDGSKARAVMVESIADLEAYI